MVTARPAALGGRAQALLDAGAGGLEALVDVGSASTRSVAAPAAIASGFPESVPA